MRRVKVAAAAEEDLKEIWSYIAERNAEAANGAVREIAGKFAILRDYPQMGREQDKLLVNLRSFAVKQYFISISRLKMESKFYGYCTAHEI